MDPSHKSGPDDSQMGKHEAGFREVKPTPSIIEIPKLSKLVVTCDDPDLIPMLHLERVYPYPLARKPTKLPQLSIYPQLEPLPGISRFEAKIRKQRKI